MHACKHAKKIRFWGLGGGWWGQRVGGPGNRIVRFKGDKRRPDFNVTPHSGDKVCARSKNRWACCDVRRGQDF